MMKITVLLMSACIFFFPLSVVKAEDDVSAKNAWIPEAPPGMNVMAAYVTIMNNSDHAMDVTGVSSDQFERVEMHRTVIENEQVRMIKQDRMKINAGESLKFEPGGSHLMLFNPKKSLKEGDEIDLKLTFTGERTLAVKAQVRKHANMRMEHHR
jgi:copper(I)-binding protein